MHMPIRVFKEEEKEALRRKMLAAGLPLLKKYGMTHMSVAKITDAASIGTSTFYNFWKNKEEYVVALGSFQEYQILQQVLTPEMTAGTRKPGKAEVRKFLTLLVDDSVSIIPWLTLSDESLLFRKTDAFIPDEEKESAKTMRLLSGVEGVRRNIRPAVIANLVKILALTAESRAELHTSVYHETIDCLITTILDQIFDPCKSGPHD